MEEVVATIGRQALLTVLYVGGPVLVLGLLAGLAVSIFQATTQINEQTLTFVPKLFIVLLTLLLFGPWMYRVMVEFTQEVFAQIPRMVQ